MSSSFSLNITLEANIVISCKNIIELLLSNNWSIIKEGYINYLPLNDNDMFDWTCSKISKNDFLQIVEEKEKAHEIVGVEIVWLNNSFGGNLLLNNAYDFTFGFDINRKYSQKDFKIPDFNWYAEKIISILKQQYYILEYKFEFIY